MTDREKVIKGLERCIEKLDTVVNKTHGFNCMACPYFRKCDSSGYLIGLPLMRDALALLNAQEPHKKGYWIYPLSTDCSCSECGNQPEHEPGESVPLYDYCPYCGAEMEVKWE